MGKTIKVAKKTIRDNGRVAILTAVNIERRDIIIGKVEQVEKFSMRGKVANTIGNYRGAFTGKGDEFGRMGGNANASALNGSGDNVERVAKIGPIG